MILSVRQRSGESYIMNLTISFAVHFVIDIFNFQLTITFLLIVWSKKIGDKIQQQVKVHSTVSYNRTVH